MNYNIMPCSRQMFINAIFNSDKKLDSFARTFLRKADMQKQWDYCYAVVDSEDNVCAAIITTHSKKEPKIANLQLLHTFSNYRRSGMASILCFLSLQKAIENNCKYYRVSAEPNAVKFYEKIGFKFLGMQKSKCCLSMFRINGPTFNDGIYTIEDTIINSAVNKKGKGGCIKIFNNE